MQRFTYKGLFLITFLALSVAAVTVIALVPQTREKLRDYFLKHDRIILAKASGYVSFGGLFISVFKVKENNSLFIEIYSNPKEDGSPNLIQTLQLSESRDGYFNFLGNATNLALSDADKNGTLDILVPTYDEQMNARLHIFEYNAATQSFEKKQPQSTDESTPSSEL